MTAEYGAALFFTSLLGMLLGVMLWDAIKWVWARARATRERRRWERVQAEVDAASEHVYPAIYHPETTVARARVFHPDGRVTVRFYVNARASLPHHWTDPHVIGATGRWGT